MLIRVSKIEEVVNSNEFWGMNTGDHQNMIWILLECIEEMKNVLALAYRALNEGMEDMYEGAKKCPKHAQMRDEGMRAVKNVLRELEGGSDCERG